MNIYEYLLLFNKVYILENFKPSLVSINSLILNLNLEIYFIVIYFCNSVVWQS